MTIQRIIPLSCATLLSLLINFYYMSRDLYPLVISKIIYWLNMLKNTSTLWSPLKAPVCFKHHYSWTETMNSKLSQAQNLIPRQNNELISSLKSNNTYNITQVIISTVYATAQTSFFSSLDRRNFLIYIRELFIKLGIYETGTL